MPPPQGVWCLKVGEINLWKAELTYGVDFDVRVAAPVFVFLIRSGRELTLVDAGFRPGAARRNNSAKGTLQLLRRALKRVSVEPGDVRNLVLTHLHTDHSSFIGEFRRARVFVQSREVEFARNPLPTQAQFFDGGALEALQKSDVELVDGDKGISGGVRLVHTPGHTPGSQSVSVELDKSDFVICGDTIPMYHNWRPSDKRLGTPVAIPRIPPAIHSDLKEWFWSCRKIEGLPGTLIPSHDPLLEDGTAFR
ncbi:MAG: N-acyl homoserine lactonase family protein [Nitrososphaerota archaeon]|nr:N-acyl homoserine lactonase family protein [Nitrososphaerota archaeon]MDG6919792.1 N-acyl homoserine lactonase family protein [Nitrososphaerota archaeon]MDG6969437.1 N-acyl homoserine lactonase family protein [Nitrososphaerota archaeon]MDG6973054.1 N-acyl homoserine lactonase family protein [Nitrososphaerota archaeon]MDG6976946.1 N-acyl homoserine lactonase family protein [Nitrososphaerota archaeon]